MKGSKPKDNEGNSSPANPDDEEYGFMDMVVSSKLKSMSSGSDYSRYSEPKPKFSGSKNQGRFGLGLSSYRSMGT